MGEFVVLLIGGIVDLTKKENNSSEKNSDR